MLGINKTQLRVLRAILAYQKRNGGASPSHAEVCAVTGVAKSKLGGIASGLRDRGYIWYEPGIKRSFHVTEQGEAFINKWSEE